MIDFRVAAGVAEPVIGIVGDPPPVLIGMSPAVDRLRRAVLRAAAADVPLLVAGERGSGRSLAARAIHAQGPRAERPCAVIPCEAVPEAFLEAELFGRDAARSTPPGHRRLLEVARGGTVILENLEAAPERTQALLDRWLATGSSRTRVIATSTVPPLGPTGERHNPALWARFAGTQLQVPSLRERALDIPLLSEFFAAAEADAPGSVFSGEAMRALCAYSWPGNVTQLRGVVQRLLVSAKHTPIQPADLPVGIRPRRGADHRAAPKANRIGEQLFERVQRSGENFWSSVYPLFMQREITRADVREVVRQALRAVRGNPNELARVLNIPASEQRKFVRFLRRYGCDPRA